MWKKLLISLLAIIGTFSVFYVANFDQLQTSLEAVSVSPSANISFDATKKSYSPAGGLNNVAWPSNGWMDFTNNSTTKLKFVLFDVYNPIDAISVSAVVKTSAALSGKATIIGNCEYGGAYLYVDKSSTTAKEITYAFSIYLVEAGGWQTITKTIPYNASDVIYLMGTYGDGRLEFFINGNSVGRKEYGSDTIKAADKSTKWVIGGDPNGSGISGQLFQGYVSNAAVFGAKVNEDITFINKAQGNLITSYTTYRGDSTTVAVANKSNVANVKASDVSYCILNANDECIQSMTNGIISIYPAAGTGTAEIVGVKKGTTKIRAFYEQSITTAGNVPVKSYTDLQIEVKDPLQVDVEQKVTTAIAGAEQIQAGKVIGTMNISGGTEPYTYSLSGSSADYFSIDGTNIIVNPTYVSGGLPLGTYTFQIDAEDADHIKASSENLTITVSQSSMSAAVTIVTSSLNQTIGEFLYHNNEGAIQAGGKLGTLTITNGLSPYTVKVLPYGSDTSNQNFEIAGLDANNQTTSSSLSIHVKQNAPALSNQMLKVGTYPFIVSVVDASGKSSGELKVSIKINANIPTLQFTPNKTNGIFTYGEHDTKANGVIGKLTSRDGWGSITHKVIAPSSAPSSSDWKSFAIAATSNADGSWNVIVNEATQPNGLATGTYTFALQACGADGGCSTKDTTIQVTRAVPTISFVDQTTAYININSAQNPYTNFKLNTSNTDSTFLPKLEFSPLNAESQAGLLQATVADKNTFHVGFQVPSDTTKLPMRYTLSYTADQTKNFEAVKNPVTKEFVLYKGMSAPNWKPLLPIQGTKLYASDVKASVELGAIMPQAGVGTYTYSILTPSDSLYEAQRGSDYGAFSLNKTTGEKGETITVKNKSALKPNVNTDGALSVGDYHIQVKVVDVTGDIQVLPITISVYPAIQSSFYFVDHAGGNDITNEGLTISYDAKQKKLLAEGGSTTKSVVYALAPDEKQPQGLIGAASDYVRVDQDGTMTPLKSGTVVVMATKPQDDTYEAVYTYMKLIISKSGQTLIFDDDVPEFIPYYSGFSLMNIGATLVRNDGTKGTITYRSTTPATCTIDTAQAPVAKAIGIGTCTIIAENTGDANYEAISATKHIKIYQGIQGIVRQRVDKEQLRQGSELAKAGSTTIIAGVDSLSGGDGNRSFEAISAKKNGIEYGEYFALNAATGEITPKKNLEQGVYTLSITVRDFHNNSVDLIGTLEVGYEVNDEFKITYKGEAQSDAASIELDYASAIDQTMLFQLNTIGKKGGGSVHFALSKDSTQANPALLIDETTGIIKVNRVTQDQELYKVYAYVEQNDAQGIAYQESTPVTIKITKTKQTIAFQSPDDTIVAYGDDIANQTAQANIEVNGVRKQGVGTIKYASLNPDALEINEATGRITLKNNRIGAFTIQATISDDVGNYETATVQKTIHVYRGMKGTFTPSEYLYQGSNEVAAGSDTVLAKIYPLSGGYGEPSFDIVKAEKAGADALESFIIDPLTGDIRAKKDLTYGVYEVIVRITDGNARTVDVSGQITIGFQQNDSFQLIYQGVKPEGNLIEMDYHSAKSLKTIQLMSKNALSGSGDQTFIISKEVKDEQEKESAITITKDGKLTVNRAMKENEEYHVQAYIEESTEKGYAKQLTQEVQIRITKTNQVIEFKDPNQINKSFVEGQDPYTFEVPVITYLKDDPKIAGVGTIAYTIIQADEEHPADIQVDADTGVVSVNGIGTVTLSVSLVDEQGNYKTVGKSKVINIYSGLSASFTQTDVTLRAGGTAQNHKVGEVSANGGMGEITYAISDSDDEKNADHDLFTVNEKNGDVRLKEAISPEDYAKHVAGKDYKLIIIATAGGQDTFSVEAIIQVAPALQNFYFTDASGTEKKTVIEETYVEHGSFYLYANRKGGGAITYRLRDTSYQDVIAIDTNRNNKVMILRASDETNADEIVEVEATVAAKDGYEEQTIYIPVHIKKAVQTICFDDPEEAYIPYEDALGKPQALSVVASLQPSGIVQYDVLTAEACEINEQGLVTALQPKTCIIKASNQNQNYLSVSAIKKIHFYEAVKGDFKQRISLKQGDEAIQGVQNTNSLDELPWIAEVLHLYGGDGATYQFTQLQAVREEDGIEVSELFYMDEATGAIKAQKKVGYGTYAMKLMVQDGYGNTSTIEGRIVVGLQENKEFKILYQGKEPDEQTIIKDYHSVVVDDGNELQLETTGRLGNQKVQYDLVKEEVPEGLSSAISFDKNHPGMLHVYRAMQASETYSIMAYVEQDLDQGLARQETQAITIQILPSKQELYFEPSEPEGYPLTQKTLQLKTSSHIAGSELSGVGAISYTSSNPDCASVDQVSGEVTFHATGFTDIIATIKDPNNNYETATAKKRLTVYEGVTVDFVSVEHVQASKKDIQNVLVGNLEVYGGSGSLSYQISQKELEANEDYKLFSVNEKTGALYLKQAVTPEEFALHGPTYHVQALVSVGKDTLTKDIEITLEPAHQALVFIDQEGNVIDQLITGYQINKTVQLTTLHEGNGKVTYRLIDEQHTGALTQDPSDERLLHIHHTTGEPSTIFIEASIEANGGYESASVRIPVIVTPSKQTIQFKQEGVLYVAINDTHKPSISSVAHLYESDGTLSKRSITYESERESICTVDAAGTVTPVQSGTCRIKASNDDEHYERVEAMSSEIIIYDDLQMSYTSQSELPQANSASSLRNASIGSIQASGGIGDLVFSHSEDISIKGNEQGSLVNISEQGQVYFTKDITAEDLRQLQKDEHDHYIMNAVFTVEDEQGHKLDQAIKLTIRGAALKAAFDTENTGIIKRTYEPNASFLLTLVDNAGHGIPTYRFKEGAVDPQGVLKDLDSQSGIVTIENATIDQAYTYVEAQIPAKNGYEGKIIEAPVFIEKAKQPLEFPQKVINLETTSQMELILNGIKAQDDQGNPLDWTLSCQDEQCVVDIDTHTIRANGTIGESVLVAEVAGNRNYHAAQASITVIVSIDGEGTFIIGVPSVTYGDEGTNEHPIKASIVYDGSEGSEKVQTWTSSDPSIADIDEATGELVIKHAGETWIRCVQTSKEGVNVEAEKKLIVKPKPLTVIIDDKVKKVGEAVPPFTIKEVTGLVKNDTIGLPSFRCVDENNVTVNDRTKKGTYRIIGQYEAGAYPDYDLRASNIKHGYLNITQDLSDPAWYELIGKDTNTNIIPQDWVNEAVYIKLHETASQEYDRISIDQRTWAKDQILYDKEGNQEIELYFQNHETKALATPQKTVIKLDHTPPAIVKIDGKEVERSKFRQLVSTFTFQAFDTPQDQIDIEVEDIKRNDVNEVSGPKEVTYRVYTMDDITKEVSTEPYMEGVAGVTDGLAQITFTQAGTYQVCVIAKDYAGNTGTEACKTINHLEHEEAFDENDTNQDGCQDINIEWKTKDESGKEVLHRINIDRNNDAIPDLNIDADGDGIADLNVDSDGDGAPDLNLVKLTKKDWDPKQCVSDPPIDLNGVKINYCTGTDAQPQLNVDQNHDLIPDVNITTKGNLHDLTQLPDPDLNVTKNGEVYLNITKLHSWLPETDVALHNFIYDTQIGMIAEWNIDSDDDKKPDINIDLDGDGIPDLNIDTDGDGIPDLDIDGNADGKADVNWDQNGDGIPDTNLVEITAWKPDNDVAAALLYDTMTIPGQKQLKDHDIIVECKNGLFLPSVTLQVKNVTTEPQGKKILQALQEDGTEINTVYEIALYQDGKEITPEGMVRVKIPLPSNLSSPHLFTLDADGSMQEIEISLENQYLVFETNTLGMFMLGNNIDSSKQPSDSEIPDNSNQSNEQKEPSKQVDSPLTASLTNSKDAQKDPHALMYSIGGVRSGDSTALKDTIIVILLSMLVLYVVKRKYSH